MTRFMNPCQSVDQIDFAGSSLTSNCIHTMNGRTLRSRATSHLRVLVCRLEAGAEMDGECQRSSDRDPCEGAMVLWWVFGMATSVVSSRCVCSLGYQTYV